MFDHSRNGNLSLGPWDVQGMDGYGWTSLRFRSLITPANLSRINQAAAHKY